MAPDACPRAKNRKRFDPKKSGALAVMLEQERGNYFPQIEAPVNDGTEEVGGPSA